MASPKFIFVMQKHKKMDGFFDQLIDTAQDIVETVGTNAQAAGDYNAAKVELLKTRTQAAALNAAAKVEQKMQQMQLIQTVVIVAAIFGFLLVAASIIVKIRK